MTGQRRPPGYGRAIDAPLQLAVPRRLPGGVWGQQPLTGTFSYDANGFPIDPATQAPAGSVLIDLSSTSQGLTQTEWPIPTRWEIQIGLVITCVNGTFSSWPGASQTAGFQGGIETAIESAGIVQPISLIFGPGVYPFVAASAGIPGLSATFPVVAQQVRVRYQRVELVSDPNLSGLPSTWAWSINTMIGLTAPAIA